MPRVAYCLLYILLLVGCEKKQSTLYGIHPDSLEATGHELYRAGDYREALSLYSQGISTLRKRGVTSADDSLLMADLLIRKAYCKYHLDNRQDRDQTWLSAWRYVQADEDVEDLVIYAQRIASLHSRRNQLHLEIQILQHADTLAAQGGLDSLRKVVSKHLKGALVECFRSPRCSVPDEEEDSTSLPTGVFLLIALAIGLILGVWVDPAARVARYPVETDRVEP